MTPAGEKERLAEHLCAERLWGTLNPQLQSWLTDSCTVMLISWIQLHCAMR